MNEGKRPLLFLHLSDIHFQRHAAGEAYDLDADLRNELERDVHTIRKELGEPTAILITGDVAFKGASDEYDTAWEWLRGRLFEASGCPTESIWCVPGNHDVDRSCILTSRAIRTCHDELRTVGEAQIDQTIVDYLSDSFVFYRSIEEYNRFARRFGCDIDEKKPTWKARFKLSDGFTLCIHGLNSTLISDGSDSRDGGKLVLGSDLPPFSVPVSMLVPPLLQELRPKAGGA